MREVEVNIKVKAPAGATHYYITAVRDEPSWLKTEIIDGIEYWQQWHRHMTGGRWLILGRAKPSYAKELGFTLAAQPR